MLGFAPYLHAAPRGNSITPDRQRAFIAALAASGIVTQAARTIGASLEALYKLRRLPGAEGFAAAWDAAIERGLDRLEDCALELALAGEELPIASGGKLLGTYRKHNFGHIRFVLSQRRAMRWAAESAATAQLAPGHPVYDRLKRQWEQALAEEQAANSEKIVQDLNARFERIIERRRAATARDGSGGEDLDGD